MAPFVAWCGRQFNLPRLLIGLSVALTVGVADRRASAAEPVTPAASIQTTALRVLLDQAKIIKLPDRTVTLVVGNPLIADVSVQAGRTLVLTGKSYGVTNLVALDKTGQILMDSSVEVQGPGGNIVVMYRGIERETYTCTPNCERRITLGDAASYFSANLTQSGTLNTQAQAVQPK
jgi:Flp pilus assembly secretin CpaC